MASSRGHVDCAGVLIDASVELDFQDKWGNTALHMAIRRHYSPVAMQLLHAGADFDIVNCVSALCDVSSYLIRRHTCNMMAPFKILFREGHCSGNKTSRNVVASGSSHSNPKQNLKRYVLHLTCWLLGTERYLEAKSLTSQNSNIVS